MTSYTYTTNIPGLNNNPSFDQSNMRTNTNSISNLIGVDHITFNKTNGGYHTIIHQMPQSGNPSTITGVSQIYPKNVTVAGVTATQLFVRSGPSSGSGDISQLTGHRTATEGYQWLGGILMQWGTVTIASSSTSTGTVVFSGRTNCLAFPTNLFNVQMTGYGATAGLFNQSIQLSWDPASSSNTQFKWKANNSGSSYAGFYWIAVGN